MDKFIIDFNRTNKIVGHNINYDKKIIGAEMYRMGMADIMDSKETICTMKSSIDFCQLPGFRGFKFPTLQELYKKLFKQDREQPMIWSNINSYVGMDAKTGADKITLDKIYNEEKKHYKLGH